MSSIQSSFAQPKTRSFVANFASSYFITDAGLATLLAPAATVSIVGSVYTFTTAAAFKTAFTLNTTGGSIFVQGETFEDMGADVNGNVTGFDAAIKLRRVKRNSGTVQPSYTTGWVVVENNVSEDTTFSAASSRVGVARV